MYFALKKKQELTAEHTLIGDSQNPYVINTADRCSLQCFNFQLLKVTQKSQ